MSKTVVLASDEKMVSGFDYRRAMEEAARCLLCHDAPCSEGCPAGTDPGRFIRALRFKNVLGAAEIIRTNNPLGGTCAEICPQSQLCQEACSRCGIDKPIQIGRLQQFIVEQEKETGFNLLKAKPSNGKKVACIGAGPASLACARQLALEGFAVTVYEREQESGGMLTYAIPGSRLTSDLVAHDISLIVNLGVTFKYNENISFEDAKNLLKEYDAVFVGVGLQKEKSIGVPGSELEGVVSALSYLKMAKTAPNTLMQGGKVVVLGGGDVAMDCALTAKQHGCEVTIVYRRTIEEAPAHIEEILNATSMGIPMICQFAPEEVIGKDGKVVAFKAKGRDGVSTLNIKTDMVIQAIGQGAEDSYASIVAEKGIFLGGDITGTKGKTVVEAVAEGKTAAEEIQAYVKGGGR